MNCIRFSFAIQIKILSVNPDAGEGDDESGKRNNKRFNAKDCCT